MTTTTAATKVTMNNALMVNGVPHEILKITKNGIDCREARKAGRDILETGYTFIGRHRFWADVRSGEIVIL